MTNEKTTGADSASVSTDLLERQAHPCETAPGEYDHEWEFRDDSFDHEFGTERVWYWECERCGATRDVEAGDTYFEDYGVDDYAL